MINNSEKKFNSRLQSASAEIKRLHDKLYADHPSGDEGFKQLLRLIENAFSNRSDLLKERDINKIKNKDGNWFLSNRICGMSLYVDRFCGSISNLNSELDYFKTLGVNLLHLMPVFESPANESDGGYAVSNFRKVDERFGNLNDLESLQQKMQERNMYLMMDIVLNHTSSSHDWALKAKQGDQKYQDYYYFFDDRQLPDLLERTLPEIFPESSPGNFTYIKETGKWVMTVFHNYQWDLNYRNPAVLNEMLDNIFFYANTGVDILRIDAPAFIWKQSGTTSQNLDEAHIILKLIKQCVQVAAPGMALLAEAIVAPSQIMKYFGTDEHTANECDFAYNATQMATQWDALATGDTRIMLAAQDQLMKKPLGTSWITYTRCHDDIGLGYDDYMIGKAGYDPFQHRNFLKNYYSGNYPDSPAKGALFSVNEKTGDARISGSLASLCGLEKALDKNDSNAIELSVRKIILMQAQSLFIGGVPMLFYGDELGYTNDYSYLQDPDKDYDNRWMHRPLIDKEKNNKAFIKGTTENKIFTLTKKLISLRNKLSILSDKKNMAWLSIDNIHVAGFIRTQGNERLYCIFNFGNEETSIRWTVFNQNGMKHSVLFDHWDQKLYASENAREDLILQPYQFLVLEPYEL